MLTLCIALLVTAATGNAPAPTTDEIIRQIRAEFDRINEARQTLPESERTVLGLSAEGAKVSAFREMGAIVKISAQFLGETSKDLSDFYFKNGQLFFCYSRRFDYGGHIKDTRQGKKLKNDLVGEDRLYFADGHLIRWLRGKMETSSDQTEFRGKEAQVLSVAAALLKEMKTAASD